MTEPNLHIGVRDQVPAEGQSPAIDRKESSRELTNHELRQLRRTLQETPQEIGYSIPTWTVQLIQRYIRNSFGVAYPLPFIERLVRAVGVAHRLEGRNV